MLTGVIYVTTLLIRTRYTTLKKSGDFERIAAQDLSAVRGLIETEIQTVIEELKRSTNAIEKQTEALKLQQNAMSSLVKNEQRTSQARATSAASQHRKWVAESGQVGKAVSLRSLHGLIMLLRICRLKTYLKV
jgi:hypothetical protein